MFKYDGKMTNDPCLGNKVTLTLIIPASILICYLVAVLFILGNWLITS